MPTVTIQGKEIAFPDRCPVCEAPAATVYRHAIYGAGPLILVVRLEARYCAAHAEPLHQSDHNLRLLNLAAALTPAVLMLTGLVTLVRLVPGVLSLLSISMTSGSMTLLQAALVVFLLPSVHDLTVFLNNHLPPFMRKFFEPYEAAEVRSALRIVGYSIPVFKPESTQVIFRTLSLPYARQLHVGNPGSTLNTETD